MFSIYLIIGALSGTLAGMLGIGGGVIVVPALATALSYFNVLPAKYVMHIAIGTSLAAMILTLLSALYSHIKLKNVRWDVVKMLIPGLIIGTLVGAEIAHLLPSGFLKKAFSIFLCLLGAKLLLGKTKESSGKLPSKISMFSVSSIIGLLSSILGAGGGTMLIPFMLRSHINIRQAAGTSVACGICIGMVASILFMVLGNTAVGLKWCTGYIYWPAFLGISLSSVICAPLGAKLGRKLPTHALKRLFGGLLILIAIIMFIY